MTSLLLVRGGHSESAEKFDWSTAVFFGFLFILLIAAAYLLNRDTEYDHRVSPDQMHQSGAMTTALREAKAALPDNVAAMHCYFRPWGGGGEQGMAHVQCDVTLRGRAVRDMGGSETVWIDDVYANPNEPGNPLHGFNRDTDTMLATDFNFAIRRGDGGELSVLSNVDERKLSLPQASGMVVATAQVFRPSMAGELADAASKAPDSVKSTWHQ